MSKIKNTTEKTKWHERPVEQPRHGKAMAMQDTYSCCVYHSTEHY